MQTSLRFSNVGASEVFPAVDKAFKARLSVLWAWRGGPLLHMFLHDGAVQLRRAHESAWRLPLCAVVATAAPDGSASAGESAVQAFAMFCAARSGALLLHVGLHDGPT